MIKTTLLLAALTALNTAPVAPGSVAKVEDRYNVTICAEVAAELREWHLAGDISPEEAKDIVDRCYDSFRDRK